MMKRVLLLCAVVGLAAFAFAADESQTAKPSKAQDRVQAAADVLNEIQSAPDQGIPSDVLGSAECVAVVPSMLNGGFVVGARYGRGLASCRNPKGWSAPAFFTIKGGSFGLQIGGQAIDLVMLVMNDDGMRQLLSSQFKLGADASVAAGPAAAIWNSSRGVFVSRLICASPPNRNRSIRRASIPCRRAISACASSWKIREA